MKQMWLTILIFSTICAVSLHVEAADQQVHSSSIRVTPLQNVEVIEIKSEQELVVTHQVKDERIYVECFLNDFMLSEEKAGSLHEQGEGHLRLYVDDEHVATLFEAAFIIEGLAPGEHTITVSAVKNDRSPYGFDSTFSVTL
ncbi:hypothetical protein M3212_00835 [Alkalihalobacillus oceani]|uniref:hypothetical protein n=1 Tax=Halalkalibacter oceani TaxID=1653776 RepID=UPI0020411575|nr:hypothetical protein [Halalkalibacter oceani]MCM3759322.1 hypothetical protein [Halalkalibacter oceani]